MDKDDISQIVVLKCEFLKHCRRNYCTVFTLDFFKLLAAFVCKVVIAVTAGDINILTLVRLYFQRFILYLAEFFCQFKQLLVVTVKL